MAHNCDENFKTMVIEVKKEIKEELTTKLSELEKQINGLGQKATTDSESLRNFFTKKEAEMEGRFATRAETEARLSELEKRLNSDQARVNDEKASTSQETGSVELTRYVKFFPKLILWIAGLLVFAITVSLLCFLVDEVRQKGLQNTDFTIGVCTVVFSCICVIMTEFYFAYMYLMYGGEGLYTSLEKFLFS